MKTFFLFIVLMRALAAILITNAHYTGVYPTDLIANGGLLGDVLFFAISGFCLANTNVNFGRWYLRRFIRIYIPVWLITVIYMILGAYVLSYPREIVDFFIWPTHWHFVASIILLYIPLYFVVKHIEFNTKNYTRLAGAVFLLQLLLYFTIYDRSYYHIDNVREPMIEFLFFQSMLLGLHFRWETTQNDGRHKEVKVSNLVYLLVLFIVYFTSKVLFVKLPQISEFQITNQVLLLGWVTFLFKIFINIKKRLAVYATKPYWKVVTFIADRTLEIYLVQYVILDYLKIGPFPMNWLLLTVAIVIGASFLRWLSQKIISKINFV